MPVIHFVAGLPRSGSTLLCNILKQNPQVCTTTTSPLLEVLIRTRNGWQEIAEYNSNPQPKRRDAALRGLLNGYYAEGCDSPEVVFDKHRGWPIHIEFVEYLLRRKVKILCSVRSTVDILSSLEKLYRREKTVRRFDGESQAAGRFLSVKGRADVWMGETGLVGSMYAALKDAILRGFVDRLYFVDFDDLTKFPKDTMSKIYRFLEMDEFEHDFDNVEQVEKEDDRWYGFEDLHTIKNVVKPVISDAVSVLGREVAAAYSPAGVDFWRVKKNGAG